MTLRFEPRWGPAWRLPQEAGSLWVVSTLRVVNTHDAAESLHPSGWVSTLHPGWCQGGHDPPLGLYFHVPIPESSLKRHGQTVMLSRAFYRPGHRLSQGAGLNHFSYGFSYFSKAGLNLLPFLKLRSQRKLLGCLSSDEGRLALYVAEHAHSGPERLKIYSV